MMEVEPADTPPGNPPSDSVTPRKRICLPSEAGSEDTELYSVPSDDSTDDDFELVLGKKAKRKAAGSGFAVDWNILNVERIDCYYPGKAPCSYRLVRAGVPERQPQDAQRANYFCLLGSDFVGEN
ncbi:hypothetical protein HPB48_000278 [Haemaphysalis longicornis]|uniref:Uncharacterized protein n=1 Tax=Haemaphysalis longicornis TaxID=44386 RepID=A0A9J6GAM1_HAELO|nr:hypothetical protein HPB48_000278 [Haemaphysalis longicornis]